MAQLFNQQNMSALINAVYAAGSDPSKWQDFVQQLHALFPRGPTVLYGHDAKVDRFLGMVHDGLSDDDNSRFAKHYAAISPFTKPILKSPLRRKARSRGKMINIASRHAAKAVKNTTPSDAKMSIKSATNSMK